MEVGLKIIGRLDVRREQDQRVYDGGGLCPCLRALNSEVKIMEVKIIGQMDNTIDHTFESANRVYDKNGLCPTIPTCTGGTHGYANPHVFTRYRIRRLTPRECWRLMGFSDEDFGKAEKVCSATQLYKQAGNSIVVNVLMAIFSQMNIKGVKPWNEVHNEKK